MITRRLFLGAFSALLLPAEQIVASQQSSIRLVYHPNVPPYSFLNKESNQVEGILVDLIDALSPTLNQDFNHKAYPWKRAQSMLKNYDDGADAFCCPATHEREKYALFAPTPITTLQESALFFNPRNPNAKRIKTAQYKKDFYSLKGAAFLGNSSHAEIWKDHPNVIEVQKIDLIIKMLLRGRIDFYFADPIVTGYIIKKMGLAGRFEHISLAHIIKPSALAQMRFGLRRSYPEAEKVITELDTAIKKTITPALHNKIIGRYI